MSDHYQLHLGDCIAGMRSMADGSVDCVITDPPYAAAAMKNARSGKTIKKRRDGQIYDFGYQALDNELRTVSMAEFARLAKRWVVVWCDIESDEAWREAGRSAGLRYLRTAVWLRENSCPQFSGDRPAQDIEACIIFHAANGRLQWNGGGRGGSRSGPIVNSRDEVRIHASPKPLWLMLDQVRCYSNPNELILDPFAGSATTGVACIQTGRRFIGFESNATYHAAASRRLANAVLEHANMQRQEQLFTPPMKQLKLVP